MLTRVPRTFLIDTDTASDDAVALIMALRAAEVRVAAITVVAGNVDVKQATRNALYTAELCGSNVPIFSGADRPLLRLYQNATWCAAYKIQTGENGICLPDPVAMCIALDPTVGTVCGEHYVEVETQSELTRGMTVVDRLNVAHNERNRAEWHAALNGGHQAKVCWQIDNRGWKDALYRELR